MLSGVTMSVAFTKVGQSCVLNLLSCNICYYLVLFRTKKKSTAEEHNHKNVDGLLKQVSLVIVST